MTRYLAPIGALFLAAILTASGQSADERYIWIYTVIQEADNLTEKGAKIEAASKYREAQGSLYVECNRCRRIRSDTSAISSCCWRHRFLLLRSRQPIPRQNWWPARAQIARAAPMLRLLRDPTNGKRSRMNWRGSIIKTRCFRPSSKKR